VQGIESEVKFHLPDPAAMRGRLLALGARSLGRSHERNLRFESADGALLRRRTLLRLRQDRKVTLTFKSPLPAANPDVKQMRELEVEVNDFDGMQAILGSLGFHPVQTYEKWREPLLMGSTVFCLDALPYGDFLEIEGPAAEIPRLARMLELDWESRILATYLEIFARLKTRYNLPFSDLTFRNFEGASASVLDCLPQLTAGGASAAPA
jgi:adenylate cyclase class 2